MLIFIERRFICSFKIYIYIFLNRSMETSTISSQNRSPGQYLIAVKNKPPS